MVFGLVAIAVLFGIAALVQQAQGAEPKREPVDPRKPPAEASNVHDEQRLERHVWHALRQDQTFATNDPGTIKERYGAGKAGQVYSQQELGDLIMLIPLRAGKRASEWLPQLQPVITRRALLCEQVKRDSRETPQPGWIQQVWGPHGGGERLLCGLFLGKPAGITSRFKKSLEENGEIPDAPPMVV